MIAQVKRAGKYYAGQKNLPIVIGLLEGGENRNLCQNRDENAKQTMIEIFNVDSATGLLSKSRLIIVLDEVF